MCSVGPEQLKAPRRIGNKAQMLHAPSRTGGIHSNLAEDFRGAHVALPRVRVPHASMCEPLHLALVFLFLPGLGDEFDRLQGTL